MVFVVVGCGFLDCQNASMQEKTVSVGRKAPGFKASRACIPGSADERDFQGLWVSILTLSFAFLKLLEFYSYLRSAVFVSISFSVSLVTYTSFVLILNL